MTRANKRKARDEEVDDDDRESYTPSRKKTRREIANKNAKEWAEREKEKQLQKRAAASADTAPGPRTVPYQANADDPSKKQGAPKPALFVAKKKAAEKSPKRRSTGSSSSTSGFVAKPTRAAVAASSSSTKPSSKAGLRPVPYKAPTTTTSNTSDSGSRRRRKAAAAASPAATPPSKAGLRPIPYKAPTTTTSSTSDSESRRRRKGTTSTTVDSPPSSLRRSQEQQAQTTTTTTTTTPPTSHHRGGRGLGRRGQTPPTSTEKQEFQSPYTQSRGKATRPQDEEQEELEEWEGEGEEEEQEEEEEEVVEPEEEEKEEDETMEEEEEQTNRVEPPPVYPHHAHPHNRRECFIAMVGVLLILFAAFLVADYVPEGLVLPSIIKQHTVHKEKVQPCFQNHPKSDSSALLSRCQDATLEPCPPGGTCVGGALIECDSAYYLPAPRSNTCLLSDYSNATITAMVSLLSNWTVDHFCTVGGNANVVTMDKTTNRPLFQYTRVSGELEVGYDLELLHAVRNTFVVVDDGKEILIGLHPSQKLNIPASCVVKNGLVSLLELSGRLLWKLLGHGIVWVWHAIWFVWYVLSGVFQEVPLVSMIVSIGGAVILFFWRCRRGKKRAKDKLRLEVLNAKSKATDILKANEGTFKREFAIRDAVKDEMLDQKQKTSRRANQHFDTDVWPRVKNLLQNDRRVIMQDRLDDGQPVTYLKWDGPV